MFKNKLYNALFRKDYWSGNEVSRIDELSETVKKLNEQLENLQNKFQLVKDYLDVEEQTITSETEEKYSSVFGGFNLIRGTKTETKLVKKIKNNKNNK